MEETIRPLLRELQYPHSIETRGVTEIEPLSTEDRTLFIPYLFLISEFLPEHLAIEDLEDERLFEEGYLTEVFNWARGQFDLPQLDRPLTSQEKRGVRWFVALSKDPAKKDLALRFLIKRELIHIQHDHAPFYGGLKELLLTSFFSKTLVTSSLFGAAIFSLGAAFFHFPLSAVAVAFIAMVVTYVSLGVFNVVQNRLLSRQHEREADLLAVGFNSSLLDGALYYLKTLQELGLKERSKSLFSKFLLSSQGDDPSSRFTHPSLSQRISSFPSLAGKFSHLTDAQMKVFKENWVSNYVLE